MAGVLLSDNAAKRTAHIPKQEAAKWRQGFRLIYRKGERITPITLRLGQGRPEALSNSGDQVLEIDPRSFLDR